MLFQVEYFLQLLILKITNVCLLFVVLDAVAVH